MKVTMKRWMVITNNILKIIGDGRTIIVSKTIMIRRVTVIKSSVIDKNIQTKICEDKWEVLRLREDRRDQVDVVGESVCVRDEIVCS